jgi:hypothetical protein
VAEPFAGAGMSIGSMDGAFSTDGGRAVAVATAAQQGMLDRPGFTCEP